MHGTSDVSVQWTIYDYMYVYMYMPYMNMTLGNLLFITFRAVDEL